MSRRLIRVLQARLRLWMHSMFPRGRSGRAATTALGRELPRHGGEVIVCLCGLIAKRHPAGPGQIQSVEFVPIVAAQSMLTAPLKRTFRRRTGARSGFVLRPILAQNRMSGSATRASDCGRAALRPRSFSRRLGITRVHLTRSTLGRGHSGGSFVLVSIGARSKAARCSRQRTVDRT